MSIKISIVTISYNNSRELRKTINSVISQTYHNIEYIVIDGKSTDSTYLALNEFANDIDVLISEEDTGIYNAINKGVKLATGDVVGLIHAGDYLADKYVVSKIATSFETLDVDMIYGHSKIYNSSGSRLIRVNKSPNFNRNLFHKGWMPSHQSVYTRRGCFTDFGYYREDLSIAADYEFLLRLMLNTGIKVARVDEFIVCFHLGGKSSKDLASIIEGNRQCKKAWSLNGYGLPHFFLFFKMKRKVRQYLMSIKNRRNGK